MIQSPKSKHSLTKDQNFDSPRLQKYRIAERSEATKNNVKSTYQQRSLVSEAETRSQGTDDKLQFLRLKKLRENEVCTNNILVSEDHDSFIALNRL